MHRPVSSAGSRASMATIRNWLKDCEDNHPQCRPRLSGQLTECPPILPTRVIDISRYPHSLRLVVSSGLRAEYVAVSHCWGGRSPVRTTKSTLEQHLEHINVRALSKTIQDAVYVAHSLSIRYLWVDYLCIVQQDDDDFHRESRTMASVYEQASFTIAATAARNGTEGCFRRIPSQGLVTVRANPDDPASGVMYFGVKDKSVEESIFKAPLNRRGWVLQEHLFSRRTVHFAADQMYWECNKMFVGEDRSDARDVADMKGFPTRLLVSSVLDNCRGFQRTRQPRNQDNFDVFIDVHRSWAQLVKYYSRCGLTRPGDKLPAIQSLAMALADNFGCHFHDGHYFADTPLVLSGLLWRTAEGSTLTRPPVNRAASWSWTSLDGAIDFADPNSTRYADTWHHARTDLKILRVAEHRPAGMPPCQALLASGAALECSAHRACPMAAVQDVVSGRCEHGCQMTGSMDLVYKNDGSVVSASLEYDVADDRPCRLWLIPLYTRWRCASARTPIYYALMVKPAPGHPFEGRAFQRVGMGLINDSDWFQDLCLKFIVLV